MWIDKKTYLEGIDVKNFWLWWGSGVDETKHFVVTRGNGFWNKEIKAYGITVETKVFDETEITTLNLSTLTDTMLDAIIKHLEKKIEIDVPERYFDTLLAHEYEVNFYGNSVPEEDYSEVERREKDVKEALEKLFESGIKYSSAEKKHGTVLDAADKDKYRKLYSASMDDFISEKMKAIQALYLLKVEKLYRNHPLSLTPKTSSISNVKIQKTKRERIILAQKSVAQLNSLKNTVMTKDDQTKIDAAIAYKNAKAANPDLPAQPSLEMFFVNIPMRGGVVKTKLHSFQPKLHATKPFVTQNIIIPRGQIEFDTCPVKVTTIKSEVDDSTITFGIDVDGILKINDYQAYFNFINKNAETSDKDNPKDIINSIIGRACNECFARFYNARTWEEAKRIRGQELLSALEYELFDITEEAGVEFTKLNVHVKENENINKIEEENAAKQREIQQQKQQYDVKNQNIQTLIDLGVPPAIAAAYSGGMNGSSENKVDPLTAVLLSQILQNNQQQNNNSHNSSVSNKVYIHAAANGYIDENGEFIDSDIKNFFVRLLAKPDPTFSDITNELYNAYLVSIGKDPIEIDNQRRM